jgi:hypothetical protein
MRKLIAAAALTMICIPLLVPTPAHAQATRTWVSGVGDDANPCSRTAPCKTFAGAISKTAAGGEINCLDSGGFGALTITKAISVICESVVAGVLASATNGIIVNAGANDVIVLRGLDIDGIGTGLNGIRFLAEAALHVQNCQIRNFKGASPNGFGIQFAPSAAAEFYVMDTVISSSGIGTTGGGINIQPSGAGSARVMLNRISVDNNVNGIKGDGTGSTGGIRISIRDSQSSGNSINGFIATNPAGGAFVNAMIDRSTFAANATNGIVANGSASTVFLGNSTITANGTAISPTNGGQAFSYKTNNINGNVVSDGATPNVILQN